MIKAEKKTRFKNIFETKIKDKKYLSLSDDKLKVRNKYAV